MKYFRQIMIILFALFLGMLLEKVVQLPIPGVVMGLVILFLFLFFGLVKVEMIEESSQFLLSHMALFFLPAGVGLMVSMEELKGSLLPFLLIILISTAVVWVVTAFTIKLFRKVLP